MVKFLDQLSQIFSCLADPTRRAILARLMAGEASAGELAEPFAMSQPAVSKHLAVLERTGLIERIPDAQWRRCKLKAAPMKQAFDWLTGFEEFWNSSFDRMDKYLNELQSGGASNGKRKRRKRD
jgi:DNA-binding transcriptional ArsR family regulator